MHWVCIRIARNVFFLIWDCSRNEFCRRKNMQNQLLSDIIIVSKGADSSSYLIFHYFGKTSDLFSLLFCNLNSKMKVPWRAEPQERGGGCIDVAAAGKSVKQFAW